MSALVPRKNLLPAGSHSSELHDAAASSLNVHALRPVSRDSAIYDLRIAKKKGIGAVASAAIRRRTEHSDGF